MIRIKALLIFLICSAVNMTISQELKQGQLAIKNGDKRATQIEIIEALED